MICSSSITVQFPRTPGVKKKRPLADVDSEATGCADGIIDHLCRGWQHGLLALLGGMIRLAALGTFLPYGPASPRATRVLPQAA